MSPLPAPRAPEAARIHELDRRRIERALRHRVRYRYVQPQVQRAPTCGWVITSPCCSRNVDPGGGVIDIAWLEPLDQGWALHAKDHAQGDWLLQEEAATLQALLDALCVDPQRVFWP